MNPDDTRAEQGSGNVYADLGIPNAGEMLEKALLVDGISARLHERHWTDEIAARAMDIDESELLAMLAGKFRVTSLAELKRRSEALDRVPTQTAALLSILSIGEGQIERGEYRDGDEFFAELDALDAKERQTGVGEGDDSKQTA
jgi:hypothetical protein